MRPLFLVLLTATNWWASRSYGPTGTLADNGVRSEMIEWTYVAGP